MNIILYNQKWLVPHKCGTRYLDAIFGVSIYVEEVDDKVKSLVDSAGLSPLFNMKSITHFVLREPLSMLESAIHTDIFSNGQMGKEIDTSKMDEIEKVLLFYIDWGTAHWSPHLFFDIYHFLRIRPDIKIVPLPNLTNFVYSETGARKYAFPSAYNFQSHVKFQRQYTRESILEFVQENFPVLWNRIKELYEIDKVWYDKIMNEFYDRDNLPIELPKIVKLKKKLKVELPKIIEVEEVLKGDEVKIIKLI